MPTFTRPTELPEWAVNDQNLPSTGQPNKEAVPLQLREIGFDYLQSIKAEEENEWRNNTYQWIGYTDEEVQTVKADITALQDQTPPPAITVSDAKIDIGPVRMVFMEATMSVASAIGSTAVETVTLPHSFSGAPLQVQLTNDYGAGFEGTEVSTAVGTTTSTTVEIQAYRLAGTNTGAETLKVFIMAIGSKP